MVLTTPESIIEQASTQNLLDDLINESVRTSARKPIMMQFDPSSGWIWRRWSGTVFSETWTSCVKNMMYATIVALFYQANPGFKDAISGFNILWGHLLSVTTFTLTFFLNQSYALWRKCYELSRRLQGRLNDLGMTLAAHASRKTPSDPTDPSTYTAPSRQILELVSRYIRLFNLLTYASFTRSHRPILTPRGMRRLVERGLLTPLERQTLIDAEVPATQRHNAVILWIIRVFVEGRQAGHIVGGAGFEEQFLEKCHVIRAQYGAIADELQGRMPLAYAHIVQVLVDFILWMYPFMAFSTGMTPFLGVIGTGLLTISYQGLFDLAKQFLDPYDNENYGKGEDPLCVDTLIAETNAGSVRWLYGFEEQPFSSQRLKDGEMFDYLLPLRGYSVEELQEMEAEKLKKEQERKEREEAERLKREEEERERQLQELSEKAEEAKEGELEDTQITKMSPEFLGEGFEAGTLEVEEEEETEVDIHHVVSPDVGTPALFEQMKSESEIEEIEKAVFDEEEMQEDFVDDALIVKMEKEVKVGENVNVVPETADSVEAESLTQVQDVLEQVVVNGDSDSDLYKSVDFDMFSDLKWFDEVGPDGKEYRLSEMLADETWEEELLAEQEKEMQKQPITLEEYTKKTAEIIKAAEDELIETEQILKATPGAEAEMDAKERKRKEESSSKSLERRPVRVERKDTIEKYDQTKLDGISQLWGLPPQDLEELREAEPVSSLAFEDTTFDGISQLWGEPISGPSSSVSEESDKTINAGGDFGSISQLWGESPGAVSTRVKKSRKNGDDGDWVLPIDREYSVDDGLWFDEVGPDGKEYRLSEMLADEEWEEGVEPQVVAPITFEDYSKQVAELKEAEEDEIRQTEAILNAPPGASTVEIDDEDKEGIKDTGSIETSVADARNDEAGEEEDAEMKVVSNEELAMLEMDALADESVVSEGDMSGATTNGEKLESPSLNIDNGGTRETEFTENASRGAKADGDSSIGKAKDPGSNEVSGSIVRGDKETDEDQDEPSNEKE